MSEETPILEERLSLNNPPRPLIPEEIQFELIYFDVFNGDGEWHIYRLPDDVREYYDWMEFKTVALRMLSSSPHFQNTFKQEFVLDYLHNTKVLTINLKTGEMFNPFIQERNRQVIEQQRRGYARQDYPVFDQQLAFPSPPIK